MKIGDRVRYTGEAKLDLTPGKIYTVESVSGTIFDVKDDAGEWNAHISDHYVPANDELAELRAFRDAAIARYPDLARPETDEEAAARFTEEYFNGNVDVGTFFKKAIAWARANPR